MSKLKIRKYVKKLLKKKRNMYKKVGCDRCDNGQIIVLDNTNLDVTYYRRCKCAEKETEKYKKFLKYSKKLKKKVPHKLYNKLDNLWIDNTRHITIGITIV